MMQEILVSGASIQVTEARGVVTIDVATYEELTELRLKVDEQTAWHSTYSNESRFP
jgi:hypothetical protein